MSDNRQTLKVATAKSAAKFCYRQEDSYFLTNSQLGEYAGDFYDHVVDARIPQWVSVVWGISSPIFAFTLSLFITEVEFKSILFFSAKAVKMLCSFGFLSSIVASLISIFGLLWYWKSNRGKLSRRSAVRWAKKHASKYCCDHVYAEGLKSQP